MSESNHKEPCKELHIQQESERAHSFTFSLSTPQSLSHSSLSPPSFPASLSLSLPAPRSPSLLCPPQLVIRRNHVRNHKCNKCPRRQTHSPALCSLKSYSLSVSLIGFVINIFNKCLRGHTHSPFPSLLSLPLSSGNHKQEQNKHPRGHTRSTTLCLPPLSLSLSLSASLIRLVIVRNHARNYTLIFNKSQRGHTHYPSFPPPNHLSFSLSLFPYLLLFLPLLPASLPFSLLCLSQIRNHVRNNTFTERTYTFSLSLFSYRVSNYKESHFRHTHPPFLPFSLCLSHQVIISKNTTNITYTYYHSHLSSASLYEPTGQPI